MKRKTLIITLVIVLLIILALVWKYCPCFKETLPENLVWSDHLSEIKSVLKDNQDIWTGEQLRPVQISREVDLTGDGVPEVLVTTGSGGAYTDDLVLFVWRDNEPRLAKFIDAAGEEGPMIFSEGASVRNGASVDWQPEQEVIYSGSWNVDFNGILADCEVNAYQYSEDDLAFVYNQGLSAGLGSDFCANLRESL